MCELKTRKKTETDILREKEAQTQTPGEELVTHEQPGNPDKRKEAEELNGNQLLVPHPLHLPVTPINKTIIHIDE